MARGNRFAGVLRSEVLLKPTEHEAFHAVRSRAGEIIDRAYSADPAGTGSLHDIEHIVMVMQENRSFDHYFGAMSGVRGFDDSSPAFRQRGYAPGVGPTTDGSLTPFRLSTAHGTTLHGTAVHDPTHDWAPQHECWNNGAMDRWVTTHLEASGPGNGPATMGYYTREDIPVHYALADAFTVCDHYFSSMMGPTDPNRLFWISGTIDPEGQHGGPLLYTPTTKPGVPRFSWTTYPEVLEEAGVSWKFYQDEAVEILAERFLSSLLERFTAYAGDESNPLHSKGVKTKYPHDFKHDVEHDTLPSVSWIVPSLLTCEHPVLSAEFGAMGIMHILDILTSNPAVWEKTALIVSYDENGGFFDHVPPPVPPPGTPGEYVSVPLDGVEGAEGIAGPVGLGFRVPALVLSPFSRGGLVASEVFDHTSQLRLIERRFGVPAPNISAWRRATVGDMTSAFDFSAAPSAKHQHLYQTPQKVGSLSAPIEANLKILFGFKQRAEPYVIPPDTAMPVQETQPRRGTPRGMPEPR